MPVIHSVELFRDIMRDGKIKLKHKFKHKVTYQYPCNVSRNGGLWDIGRELVNRLCEDFVDMTPNREHNHCRGGGGFIPMGPPYKKRRMNSGKIKAEQIRAKNPTPFTLAFHQRCNICHRKLIEMKAPKTGPIMCGDCHLRGAPAKK